MRLSCICTIIICLCASLGAGAETVSQKEAKKIAAAFFNAAHGQVMGEPKLVYNGRRLTTNSLFPPFYVYNQSAGGFVVVSAENKAFPILGYSLTDTFKPEELSENLRALLRMYALQIEAVRYDARVPEKAIAAWGDIPGYISSLLDAKYTATDPRLTVEEAGAGLDALLDMNDASAYASATYSVPQWEGEIAAALAADGEIALGVVSGEELRPLIAHGRKGDMYRLYDGTGRDRALWRLMPTELLSKGQVALFGNPKPVVKEEVVEAPHAFYEEFVAQTRSEEAERQRARESAITGVNALSEPRIQWHGGGHYTVTVPEAVREMRLFGLDGALVQRDKFRDTQVASVNLTGQPVGFYFAVFITESGTPYAFKIFR